MILMLAKSHLLVLNINTSLEYSKVGFKFGANNFCKF
jgi:hypothetical protein